MYFFSLFLTVGVCFSNINISKVRFIVKGRRRERLYPLGWSGISLETGNKANVLGNQTVDYFNLCNHLNIFGFWTAGWAFEDLFGYFLTFKKTWPWSTTLNHCDMAVVFFFFLSMITFSSFSRLHVQRTGAGVWLLAAEETGDHRGASWHQSPHLLCGANGQRHQRRQSSGPAAWTGVHTTGQCAFVPLWAFPFYILNRLSRGSVYKCC